MKNFIKRVDRTCRHWRVSIPKELIQEKGWENVDYVRVEQQWGDRIVITKVAVDEESKEKDHGSPG